MAPPLLPSGGTAPLRATQLKVSPSAITQRKDTIARRARQFWGESVIADVQALPPWRREMGQG